MPIEILLPCATCNVLSGTHRLNLCRVLVALAVALAVLGHRVFRTNETDDQPPRDDYSKDEKKRFVTTWPNCRPNEVGRSQTCPECRLMASMGPLPFSSGNLHAARVLARSARGRLPFDPQQRALPTADACVAGEEQDGDGGGAHSPSRSRGYERVHP